MENRTYPVSAALPGPRDPHLTPYIIIPERAIAACIARRVVIVTAAQSGKTEMLLDICGQRLDQKPVPILYVGPNRLFLTEQFEPRVMALLDEAPSLAKKVSRGKRMTKSRKMVAGVPLRLAHSGSSAALKSDPAALALVDEYDGMLKNIQGQGDPLGLVERRGDTYPDFVAAVTSTPSTGMVDSVRDPASGLDFWQTAEAEDLESPIWRLWQAGTRHHWAWPCPHCNVYFIPRFALARFPKDATPSEALTKTFIECPNCGGVIEDRHKAVMNQHGRYVAPGQRVDADGNVTGEVAVNTTISFWVSGFASPFVTFGERIKAYLEAVAIGDPAMIQTAICAGFGELYAPGGRGIKEWQQVAKRRQLHRSGTVPDTVMRLTCAVDVQKASLYYSIRGWGERATSWQIQSDELHGYTNEPQVWGDLTEVLQETYGGLPIALCLIDSGFRPDKPEQGWANMVYDYCLRFRRFCRATKGFAKLTAPIMRGRGRVTIPNRKEQPELDIVRLDTDFWKQRLHERLAWPEDQPGGFWLCSDATEDFCKQLISETRIVTPSGKPQWIQTSRRNHFLDCFDPQTELLTSGGWLPVRNAVGSTFEFATVNLETDEIEYQRASRGIARWHDGEMIEIKGRGLDILVTPNHRMVATRMNPVDATPRVVRAEDLTIWHKIKRTAIWRGTDHETIEFPEEAIFFRRGSHGHSAKLEPTRHVDAGDLFELLGWYVAEGHLSKRGQYRRVIISQIPGAKAEHIKALARRLGFDPRPCGDHQLAIASRQLANLAENCETPGQGRPCYRKIVPSIIKYASSRLIRRFIDGAIAGDGWTQNGHRTYATTSWQLADDMQELFIKAGVCANVRQRIVPPCRLNATSPLSDAAPQFHVSELRSAAGMLRQSDNKSLIQRVPYTGMVYCVTVPNGTLIARRNGTAFVTGNCEAMNESAGHLIGAQRIPLGYRRPPPDGPRGPSLNDVEELGVEPDKPSPPPAPVPPAAATPAYRPKPESWLGSRGRGWLDR